MSERTPDLKIGPRDILFQVVSDNPQSSEEINNELGDASFGCPDDLVRALNVLRKKGLIKGEFSKVSGKWMWWKQSE